MVSDVRRTGIFICSGGLVAWRLLHGCATLVLACFAVLYLRCHCRGCLSVFVSGGDYNYDYGDGILGRTDADSEVGSALRWTVLWVQVRGLVNFLRLMSQWGSTHRRSYVEAWYRSTLPYGLYPYLIGTLRRSLDMPLCCPSVLSVR